ncbi:hypothetical protein H920_16456 [Fukomys damarensis]|uniref:Uncharacterized protein n=1 Tax=Fukomys damarensis TaxID=885580 RepID=A0A091CUJ2_FUKDA|nr:hypothetical protein H920_16456 [Fukomys damarensis]
MLGPGMTELDPDKGTGRVAFRDTCRSLLMVKIKLVSPYSVAKESRKPEVEEKFPAWEVTIGAGMMEISNTINVNLSTLETLNTINQSSSTRDSVPQSQGAQNVSRKVASDIEVNMHRGENWPQDMSTGSPSVWYNVGLLGTGICPSPASQVHSQGSNLPTSQVLCDLLMRGASSHWQQEPNVSRLEDTGKSNSKICGSTDINEHYRKPRPGDEEKRFAGVRPSCACELSCLHRSGKQTPLGASPFHTHQRKAISLQKA